MWPKIKGEPTTNGQNMEEGTIKETLKKEEDNTVECRTREARTKTQPSKKQKKLDENENFEGVDAVET